jgi:L-cysteate sulfo-lyase
MPLSPADLFALASELPRVRLAHLPTPLEELPRFSAAVGGGVRVFVKRDDCTGLLLGGNKARHNEFLLGDAVARGCDVVVWGAGVQSNNCRQTAAGCAKLGIECRLFLSR